MYADQKNKPGRGAQRDLPAISQELIDQFVSGPMSAEDIQGVQEGEGVQNSVSAKQLS